jgi:hypothetical protein
MTDEERTNMQAAAKLEDLGVDGDLRNINDVVSGLLSSFPNATTVAATDPDELKNLISAIQNGSAANNQSARFLEIMTRLGV